TRGALVRRGDRPDSSIPAPPALPVRVAVAGSSRPAPKLSAAFVAKVRKDNDCPDEKDPNLVNVDRVDSSHSFATITLICQSGAYNYLSANYVIADGGAPQPAKFDDDNSKEDGDLHYNLYWDAKTHRLDAGMKGRGIGDCGGMQHYVWDGSEFRLVAVEEMTECRGVIDFISVWRAVVVRFAGDSGDGMQLTGGQFTLSTALAGNDLATFPDFPAEIRAPQGTTFGVSAFQINFGSCAIDTAGDQPDVLIA